MGRRRFDHLFTELCVELGLRLPRFALWMAVAEAGAVPERLRREDVLAFYDGGLRRFLHERGLHLAPRRARSLRRRVARFDPAVPTPEERLAALLR